MAGDGQSREREDPTGSRAAQTRGDRTSRDEKRVPIVEDSGVTRPYMRGIMVHSLMARGVSFDDAYTTAAAISERIRGRDSVPRSELANMVVGVVGHEHDHQPPIPIPVTLRVLSGTSSSPFSKGTLAQSLLAASVEPDDAFDVAREIELELIRGGRQEITHEALRQLSSEKLFDRFGRRAAERYLVWRSYQDPEKPVIVLLGGTAGVGKTTLALEVARRLGISRVLSTDSIRQVMRIMLSNELMPALHASSFSAHQRLPTEVGGEDPVIDGFLAQTSSVSVGVRATLDRAIEENTSLVLDGVSLVPGLIDLEEYADHAHIFNLLVARLDEEAFANHFVLRAERETRRRAVRYIDHLSEILRIQEYLLDLADRNDVPIVDNITLEGSVLLVIRHVVETLRKANGPVKATHA
jgi:2-phosphoglycerate kinase